MSSKILWYYEYGTLEISVQSSGNGDSVSHGSRASHNLRVICIRTHLEVIINTSIDSYESGWQASLRSQSLLKELIIFLILPEFPSLWILGAAIVHSGQFQITTIFHWLQSNLCWKLSRFRYNRYIR